MNLLNFLRALPSRHWRELGRLFRNHQWERNDEGEILVGFARMSGQFTTTAPDGLGSVVSCNLITTQGANYLLNVGLGGGVQHPTFYVAPFSANVAVVDTLTAANFATTQTELTTQYSETTRVAFAESVPAEKSTSNTGSPATITAASDNVTIWGAGLLSSINKGATTGVLLSAAKYATARTLPGIGDRLGIEYSLSLLNS